MNSKKIVVNNSFIVNTLRNCGYTSYTAIADIIDNSIEQDVRVEKDCTPFVKVTMEGKKLNGPIDRLLVVDNGTGMDFDTLNEAMSLGSNTGKDPAFDLGCYGTGLKTAAFSIGQVLDVYTKEAENDLYRATISLKDSLENGTDVEVKFNTIEQNSAEYTFFEKTVGYDTANLLHGTIVAISEIDRIIDNCEQFAGHLNYEIADIFNQFIKKRVVDFYVSGKKCLYTDFTHGGKLHSDGSADIMGVKVEFKCYNLNDTRSHLSGHELIDDKDYYVVSRNTLNSGVYIYRQNRLVGKALKLNLGGMGDGYSGGFRCEIFIDGNADSLFGTSFTKTISEKESNSMCKEMRDFLETRISPVVKTIRKEFQLKNPVNDITDKEEVENLKRAASRINKNPLLSIVPDIPVNNHPHNPKIEHQYRGPQKNPNPIKIRKGSKWLESITVEHLGLGEPYYRVDRFERNSKTAYKVVINADHQFYTEFFKRLSNSLQEIYCQVLASEAIAKSKQDYWTDDIKRAIFDEYEIEVTRQLGRMFL